MNNIQIANETLNIIAERKYNLGGMDIALPDVDFEEVIVISPGDGEELLTQDMTPFKKEQMCNITVINADSFEAGRKYENAF